MKKRCFGRENLLIPPPKGGRICQEMCKTNKTKRPSKPAGAENGPFRKERKTVVFQPSFFRWQTVTFRASKTVTSRMAINTPHQWQYISDIYCQLGDGLCHRSHLLREPETTIDRRVFQGFFLSGATSLLLPLWLPLKSPTRRRFFFGETGRRGCPVGDEKTTQKKTRLSNFLTQRLRRRCGFFGGDHLQILKIIFAM